MKAFRKFDHDACRVEDHTIRSATFEGMCDDAGRPTDEYRRHYEALARGGVAKIITGFAYISVQGRAIHPGQAGIDSDEKIPFFKAVTDAVHRHGAEIYLQIAHAGRQTSKSVTNTDIVAPTPQKSRYFGGKPQALTLSQIKAVVADFAQAALRAKSAGFDGVQLHAAHGYLIHEFINPVVNKRTDEYGTGEPHRPGIRFLTEIVARTRELCGADFPILVKISAGDGKEDAANHFLHLIQALDKLQLAAIEVSYGTMENAFNIFRGESIPYETILRYNFRYGTDSAVRKFLWRVFAAPILQHRVIKFSPNYNLKYARLAKHGTDTPIVCVGGFRTKSSIHEALRQGSVDYVSMCRPFICEPDLMKKFARHDDYTSLCRNCNICAVMCDSTKSTRCYCVTKERKR
ncbi:MAG: NADH:flavin oxidoreductase [Candidatus Cloacimonetes bacterium]|nr:NADH:flavin oxidoreductase [Candidatus Cloacimonadota bacterium]